MKLKETYEKYKKFKVPSLSEIHDTASEHSKTSLVIIILLVMLLLLALQYIPYYQVAHFNITNPKDLADAENSYRATLAQIFGGVAIAVGIYYTWRRITIAEEDLKATKEGQITERFTRAVDQLGATDKDGNPAIEIRLGGIYALERISNESEKDYWPIIEILTAYVRKNSIKSEVSEGRKISLDIQAILTVIARRKNCFNNGESIPLNLQGTCLQNADMRGAHLEEAHLEGANLNGARLEEANLNGAHLEGAHLEKTNLNRAHIEKANLYGAYLKGAYLNWVHFNDANLYEVHLEDANLYETHLEGASLAAAYLEGAKLIEAHLEGAHLQRAHLQRASLLDAHLEGADLEGANLTGANLTGANLEHAELRKAHNLSIDQLSKVKTLYDVELDEELLISLKEKYPALFEKPDE